jgi:hypothetical protein
LNIYINLEVAGSKMLRYVKKSCIKRSDILFYRCKCKAIPLQAWTGPEASRRLRLSDFKTVGT